MDTEYYEVAKIKDCQGRYVSLAYRRLGLKLAAFLKDKPVTPNQVSILGFVSTLAATALFMIGSHLSIILASLAVQVTVILDNADGILARLQGRSTPLGKWMDMNFGYLTTIMLYFGISYGVYQRRPEPLVWILCFIVCSFTFLLQLMARAYRESSLGDDTVDPMLKKNAVWRIINQFRYSNPLRANLITIFSIFDSLYVLLIFYAVHHILYYLLILIFMGRSLTREPEKM